MKSLTQIESELDALSFDDSSVVEREASALLEAGTDVLQHWVIAQNKSPTSKTHEGFRLLALHRQGAQGDPSFNACRETCRELAYRYNLALTPLPVEEHLVNLRTMRRVAQHLVYFIGGKMQSAELGEFCCSSRSLRASDTKLVSN